MTPTKGARLCQQWLTKNSVCSQPAVVKRKNGRWACDDHRATRRVVLMR